MDKKAIREKKREIGKRCIGLLEARIRTAKNRNELLMLLQKRSAIAHKILPHCEKGQGHA